MVRAALVLWLAAGCGRVGFDAVADEPPIDARADAPVGCLPPYVMLDVGCYRIVTAPHAWSDAEQLCEADAPDAHLVVIDSVAEHFTIHNATNSLNDVWVAYTDRVVEGAFKWLAPGGLDPLTDMCFFGAAGPNNNPNTDCVTQDGPTSCGDWHVRDCGELHAFVCERDGAAADPSKY